MQDGLSSKIFQSGCSQPCDGDKQWCLVDELQSGIDLGEQNTPAQTEATTRPGYPMCPGPCLRVQSVQSVPENQ